MYPDFNRLNVFFHVYSNGSVSSAAKSLHVTQSAVSQHLKKLEAEIEAPLFSRVKRRLVPTQAGHRLFEIVSPFLKELESGLKTIQKERNEPVGLLKIGAPVEFGIDVLPKTIAAFRDLHKGVRVHLELGHSKALLPKLEQGDLDFAFADIFSNPLGVFQDDDHLSIEPVMKEALVLICSRRYNRKYLRGDHTFKTLGTAHYIAYQKGAPALKRWFKHHFKEANVPLDIVFTVESVQGVIGAVENHMGLGVVPSHLVRQGIKRRQIVVVSRQKKPLIHRIALVQLEDKKPGYAERVFITYIKQKLRKV